MPPDAARNPQFLAGNPSLGYPLGYPLGTRAKVSSLSRMAVSYGRIPRVFRNRYIAQPRQSRPHRR